MKCATVASGSATYGLSRGRDGSQMVTMGIDNTGTGNVPAGPSMSGIGDGDEAVDSPSVVTLILVRPVCQRIGDTDNRTIVAQQMPRRKRRAKKTKVRGTPTLADMLSRGAERDRESPNASKAGANPEKKVRKRGEKGEREEKIGREGEPRHNFTSATTVVAKRVATDVPNNPERMRPVLCATRKVWSVRVLATDQEIGERHRRRSTHDAHTVNTRSARHDKLSKITHHIETMLNKE